MMTSSDREPLVEEGRVLGPQARLTLGHKILFFMLGLISALTICVLIRLSNKLTADAEHKSLMHFKEISNGRRFGN
ncbi:uncharacterized protein Dwil_GK27952 [Drosophila willistoni]|uniref:Uncharacterized protein n=1 Tax=Drosophila willistoni TaxID=7260 RepID=A0A0Q9WPH6_DROWI|nr:uncharacterized protein LOC26529954 [Drosophila willistoni]KRF97813.1 uncharacterized protein Dwil_GK27952 [Drosophila willistoni]